MNKEQKYPGCWVCDNIIDHPGMIGFLHLGFPRCFILVRDEENLYYYNFKDFIGNLAEVNWLDPSDKGTPEEQKEVLQRLYHFAIDADEAEVNYHIEHYKEMEEDDEF